MAFQAWTYFLLVASIIAMNHRYGKPYEDYKNDRAKRQARTEARWKARRAAEKKEYEESQKKRKEAKRKQKAEDERLAEIRSKERKGLYGKADGGGSRR